MIREDKKIRKALRSLPQPEPPQELLEQILSRNGLRKVRQGHQRIAWAAACLACIAVASLLWNSNSQPLPPKVGHLVAAKQAQPESKIEPKAPTVNPNGKAMAPHVKAPKVKTLTGRERYIRIRKETPKSYLASNSVESAAPSRSYMTPLKIGRADPKTSGTATVSSWAKNERGVWVLTVTTMKNVNGKQVSEITKAESDRPVQKLLVTNNLQDEQPSGGKDE